MPLARLAGLLASMPPWVTSILAQDKLDLTPAAGSGPYQQPAIDQITVFLRLFDQPGAGDLRAVRG